MTTINAFTARHQIQNQVDFIKIDAEGHDLEVIRGANDTLASVGILMWEQGKLSPHFSSTITHLERLKFECFIPALEGFVKLTHGCFPVTRVPHGNNIICASRVIAPQALLAFDLLSFFHDDDYK